MDGRSRLGTLTLAVPGRHNLQNALAAVAVGTGARTHASSAIAAGLKDFRGAERRFEVRGEPNGILVVDDYGHHPTEIAAVLAAARDARAAASSSRSSRTGSRGRRRCSTRSVRRSPAPITSC